MTMKELFAPSDMTVGKPWEKIVAFTIPMLIGNIAQQLYNTVDSIVIGKYVGDNALAAVGSASPILNLLLVLFVGISVGAGVMVSQYFGAKQRKELSMTIGNCVTLTAISSIIIMILGAVLSRPLLEMLKTPDSIIDWCTSYLVILMVGCAGSAYYNILCGILRGLGDSISALIYLLVATVINIVLDIVFVSQFHMGVAGVAYATVIAQAISAVLCMWRLMRMTDIFDFRPKYLKMKKQYSMEIIRLGLPSGITQAIFSMAMVIVQSLTNSFGEMVIAANVIIMRVDGFAMMPNFSFGTAMTTYAGQNVGARRMDRVEQGDKTGNTDCSRNLNYHYPFNCYFRPSSDGNLYEYHRARNIKCQYDEDPCGRLYCHGNNTVAFRRHAWSRRYDDPDVDFDGCYCCNPCAAGIRSGLSDQNAGAAKRTISGTLDFHAGKLVHGCASDADFL